MKKKLVMIAATVALGAFLVVGGTLAWFTASTDATNKISTGNVRVSLVEMIPSGTTYGVEKIEENGKDIGIKYTNIQPGDTIFKDPTIQYIGTSAGYVRYKVDLSVTMKDGYGEYADDIKDNITIYKSEDTDTAQGAEQGPTPIGKYVIIPEPMIYVENENKVYNIFDSVYFNKDLGNAFSFVDNIEIKVTVQAIQAANFDSPEAAWAVWGDVEDLDSVSMGSTIVYSEPEE